VEIERFTFSRRQISGLGILAGSLLGCGVVLLVVFALTTGFVARGAAGLSFFTLLWGVVFAYLTLGCARVYTEISADGVRTRTAFGTKHVVAWPEVKDIKVDNMEKRDWHAIGIVCGNGRTFALGAPRDSPTLMPDPDFKAKLERIVAAWRLMTVAAGN
jgi:hypothetical protein